MPVDLTHPTLQVPDRATQIWRYMQFPKFVSLLLSESLFFTRINNFKDDPWEGRYPDKNFDRDLHVAAGLAEGLSAEDAQKKADVMVNSRSMFQNQRAGFAVSCWHANETESDAFWRIYSRMDEGIAIRSTVGNLIDSLESQQKRNVYVSRVTYMDYRSGTVPMGNAFFPALYKRSSFSHENEIRAFNWEPQASKTTPARVFESDSGESVPIAIDKLITDILISPSAPLWFFEDVKRLLQKLGFSFRCIQSDLMSVRD